MSKNEEYLRQNIKGLLQPLAETLLSKRPKDPVSLIKKLKIEFKSNFYFRYCL